MQHTTGLLIRKKPFDRFARAIAKGIKHDIRFKPDAINALQEAAEAFLIETLFECEHGSQSCEAHHDQAS